MREMKVFIWFGVFVFVGMTGVTFARVVEESPQLQAVLKETFNIDSFYLSIK